MLCRFCKNDIIYLNSADKGKFLIDLDSRETAKKGRREGEKGRKLTYTMLEVMLPFYICHENV